MKSLLKLNDVAIIPTIFAKIKDHKLNLTLRPIVPKCMGPTYSIEKVLPTILKGFLSETERVLKSTEDFIQRIKSLKVEENHLVASLDIVSLYPSVDTDKAIKIIDNILTNKKIENKNTIIAALNLVANSNYFQFKNKIYK